MIPFLHISLAQLVEAAGYAGIFAMLFAESGLAFGIIFPGDSLLFTAGFLASTGMFSYPVLLLIGPAAAILGDSTGYWFGKQLGPRIFTKENSFFFDRRHIERTRTFYHRYGARTLVLARFVPFVRTFAPILAGVGLMPYRTFLLYNIIGGLLWGAGVSSLGYFLGRQFPQTQHYLSYIIVTILVLSVLPIAAEFFKSGRAQKSPAEEGRED